MNKNPAEGQESENEESENEESDNQVADSRCSYRVVPPESI